MHYSGQEFATPQLALEHYGTKGMKWGVRKNDSSALSKEGRAGMPPVAIGAIYAAIVIAKLTADAKDGGKFNQMKTKNIAFKKDESLAKHKSIDDIYDNVVKPINSNFGAKGTKMNCRRCTMAYEMRRRGYDVNATTSTRATGQTYRGMSKATDGLNKASDSIWGQKEIKTSYSTPSDKKAQDIFDSLASNPNGARGELGIAWAFGGGHSVAWEIVDNTPVVFDTQSAMTYRNPLQLKALMPGVSEAAYTRLDNAKIDEAFLRKWVKNAE